MSFISDFFSRFEDPATLRLREEAQEALEYATSPTRQMEAPTRTVAVCGDCCTPSEENPIPLPYVTIRKDGTCLHCGSRVVWVDKNVRFNALMRKAGKKPLKKTPFNQLAELAVSR